LEGFDLSRELFELPLGRVEKDEVRDMNPGTSFESLGSFNSDCSNSLVMAEHELSAFFKAATELFGVEEARISAEDWMRELLATDALPSSDREWRTITAKVTARLASRLSTFSLFSEQKIA
jgi:hypothetical protein